MAEHTYDGEPAVVKIYPNRVLPIIPAAICVYGCYAVARYYIWNGPFRFTADAWAQQNPVRIIMGVLGTLAFAVGAFYCLDYLLTPRPMFVFDSKEIIYQFQPFRSGAIAWHDVERIAAYRLRVGRTGTGWRLTFLITLKSEAMLSHGNQRDIKLSLAKMLLSQSGIQVVREMQRFHKVRLIGNNWGEMTVT